MVWLQTIIIIIIIIITSILLNAIITVASCNTIFTVSKPLNKKN